MIVKLQYRGVNGVIDAPSSKSYAQRALAIAALCSGTTTLHNIESSSDVDAVMALIPMLGGEITFDKERRVATIVGGNRANVADRFFIGESGLATRLFTPIASLFNHKISIEGHKSILTRPMESMRAPLESAGVEFVSSEGYLPLQVCGAIKGGEIEVDGSLSSQFISGLLIALPLCENDSVLNIHNLKSKPYIDMTLEVLKEAGVEIKHDDYQKFYIKGGSSYSPLNYMIEGDWSGASCMLVAGATAGEVTVRNLSISSSQADAKIMEALRDAGAQIVVDGSSVTVKKSELKAFEFDATHCPDLFPALAALAASCEGDSRIVGTNRLTHKESNRALTIKESFALLGVDIDISQDDIMVVKGGSKIKGGAVVDSHGDHRIAMAAAVTALNADSPIEIERAEAVDKSYSNFWRDLQTLSSSQL